MNKPVFDHSKENIVSSIGVSDAKATEISKYFRQRLNDFNQGKIKKISMVIEMAIDEKIVTTDSELLYIGFIIGMYIEHRHHENDKVESITEGLTEALKSLGKGDVKVEVITPTGKVRKPIVN